MVESVTPHREQVGGPSGPDSVFKSGFWTLKDGAHVELRPIQPNDEHCMIEFHRNVSERSVYMRYFESLSLAMRTAHPRLSRICLIDPERETVLVALERDEKSMERKIVAVGRLSKLPDSKAEVALLVVDQWQGRGLGAELLHQLIQAARSQKLTQIEAEMLRDNIVMQKVLKKFGFHLQLIDARSVRAVLSL